MADRARLAQAARMDPEAGRRLLDLDLEGIREAPLGLVVCCDRRVDPAGVLGRATFLDADLWSCACAIENLWLTARVEGVGVGWVTLFHPEELAGLVSAPTGVATLGWLCVGWPDERPPEPGLERRGWSARIDLEELVMSERWTGGGGAQENPAPPRPPISHVAAPSQRSVVRARDTGDRILSAPGSLGVLDRVLDKVLAAGGERALDRGSLVIVAADHPVRSLGVSAYDAEVTRSVAQAAMAGLGVGSVAAAASGLEVLVVDAGVDGHPLEGAHWIRPECRRGDLVSEDALTDRDVGKLVAGGQDLGQRLVEEGRGLIALGEIGIANTTIAAALTSALLDVDPDDVVGLGVGADSAIVDRKRDVVSRSVSRWRMSSRAGALELVGALGGGEVAVLTGTVLGAASRGAVVVLDGLATSVAALLAAQLEPGVASHLVAGQRSMEPGHPLVLAALGLEPLLDLRFRAGEGAGAAMAVGLIRAGLRVRLNVARTTTSSPSTVV
jgi:nicotinate-nucleotide--dimethylbenzimidazole phosphoribosyltransferase